MTDHASATRRRPAMGSRGALLTLCCYAVLVLALALLPPSVPGALRFPEARGPVWLVCSALACGIVLLLTTRDRPPRRTVLLLGWALFLLTTAQAFVVTELLALAGLYAAAPVLASLTGQLTGRPRKALLVVHVVSSACWIGVALMMSAVGVTALAGDDIDTVAASYHLMETFDVTLLGWLNFTATLSGIGVGMTSQWGVLRHYWVAAKLVISLAVLFLAFGWVHDTLEATAVEAERLAATGGGVVQLGGSPATVAAGFGFAFLQLLLAMLLSLYKPGGRTRRGRRALAARRAARTPAAPVPG
ncbi:hypothetical protein [Streptomyces millisiae]|uniref:Integral membrane protein n=1 Tax=Streptomyces millisiae TaxID=3075542 RepID=A0ABU2LJP9_9ACTN|nr:hypothetical protein [Streptomyces sp. DSM 44918]MDT0317807.1 hypothetical protein [Streptomyces sp. DSM 44918]